MKQAKVINSNFLFPCVYISKVTIIIIIIIIREFISKAWVSNSEFLNP